MTLNEKGRVGGGLVVVLGGGAVSNAECSPDQACISVFLYVTFCSYNRRRISVVVYMYPVEPNLCLKIKTTNTSLQEYMGDLKATKKSLVWFSLKTVQNHS